MLIHVVLQIYPLTIQKFPSLCVHKTCQQTDRQTEGETLGDSKMPPSQHFICRGIIKAYATKA